MEGNWNEKQRSLQKGKALGQQQSSACTSRMGKQGKREKGREVKTYGELSPLPCIACLKTTDQEGKAFPRGLPTSSLVGVGELPL